MIPDPKHLPPTPDPKVLFVIAVQFRFGDPTVLETIKVITFDRMVHFANFLVKDHMIAGQVVCEAIEYLPVRRTKIHSFHEIKKTLYQFTWYFAMLHLVRSDPPPRNDIKWRKFLKDEERKSGHYIILSEIFGEHFYPTFFKFTHGWQATA